MTDPLKQEEDLTELQRKADREKSEWPEAEESDDAGPTPDHGA